MTKTQTLKTIRKEFFTWIETNYPNVIMWDEGALVDMDLFGVEKADETISFHRSELYLVTLNLASNQIKDESKKIESILEKIKQKYNYDV